MSGNPQTTSEVFNYFLELSKPTEEDLNRVFTEEELKELCLKQKCKVDIWRWNIADDYRILFMRSGRYQKWSERNRLLMLAKAVNKIKPVIYKDEEIRKTREEEWKFQLKENILSLNLWKRRRLNEPPTVLTESDNTETNIDVRFEVDTESLTQESESIQVINRPVQENVESETDALNNNPESSVNLQNEIKAVTPVPRENIFEANLGDDNLYGNDSEDSVETVMLNEKLVTNASKILQSDEVAPEINNIYDISTLSLSINNSEISTQSQDVRTSQSQVAIPQTYGNFEKVIPATSTQSQSRES